LKRTLTIQAPRTPWMLLGRIALQAACALFLCVAPAAARAQYLLTGPGDGGQLQVGRGWAIPLQMPVPSGVYPPVSGGFPPALGVPPIPAITPAHATTSIAQGANGTLTIPPGILSHPAPGTPVVRPLFATSRAIFQIATSLRVRWPASTATLLPGGGPGPALFGTASFGYTLTYSGGVRAFGGPARFEISAGPGSAGGVIPGQPVTFHLNIWGRYLASATQALLAARNATLLQPGAAVAAPPVVTPGIVASPAIVSASFGPLGTVLASTPCGTCSPMMVGTTVTWSKGFPWTTGLITISVPVVEPPEFFFLSGTDLRVAGVGNISLVSGGATGRSLFGPAATLGWLSLTLPEPDAVLGAAAALAALALCHSRVRRRARVRARIRPPEAVSPARCPQR
jgi:hypothetical protein